LSIPEFIIQILQEIKSNNNLLYLLRKFINIFILSSLGEKTYEGFTFTRAPQIFIHMKLDKMSKKNVFIQLEFAYICYF
jgi:hypothetical protein